MNTDTDLFSLQGKVAVVTGAGGQLGRQFSDILCAAGAKVVLTDVDADVLKDHAQSLQERFPGRVESVPMDVTQRPSVVSAAQWILATCSRIDILVNNAGIGIFTPFEKRSEEELDRAIAINLKGTIWCTQVFSESMRKRLRGSIINIGSVYGVAAADPRIYGDSGRDSSEIYAATKAGVIQMTRYWAVRFAPDHVRVNCLSPGGLFNHQDETFVKRYSDKTPMGRMGNNTDLQSTLLYLAADASAYVTGQNLLVDGGFTLW